MVRIVVTLDDDTAAWLAAKVDDSMPTLRDVARSILVAASDDIQDQVGFRPCRCDALDRLSSEENSPVVFDSLVGEYQLLRDTPHGQAKHVIAYCLWCGGKAPVSKRAQLFAKVTSEELRRLNIICYEIKTFGDAIRRLGKPDFDWNEGAVYTVRSLDGAEEHSPRRVISYQNMSDTAEVRFTQKIGDLISVSFVGKYMGPPLDRS